MFESDLALVTGASRGIGRAIAMALGGAGATVIGTATTVEGAERLGAEFRAAGVGGRALVWNATDGASTDALIDALDGAEGLPTILVNNA
jgi:3-oxoacyl-[acyl-carrier protein] reductase